MAQLTVKEGALWGLTLGVPSNSGNSFPKGEPKFNHPNREKGLTPTKLAYLGSHTLGAQDPCLVPKGVRDLI